ncbi:MXAN_6652 family MXYO-CTERM-anchored protein [Archangium violaceum]|uniref:MXAN_6652 family MXYO-CTERM-anchored protein n=1 Tax=Archangium violaceum TaxID=83451 RepID=UPI0036DA26F4
MRLLSVNAMGVLVAGLFSSSSLAYSTGVTGYSGKTGVTCTACHGVGAEPPTVELSGPTSLVAGATGQYVFIIRGGPAVLGGADIAVSNTEATLTPAAGSGLERRDSELTQVPSARPFSGNELRFEFSLAAPSSGGTLTLFAAGNSANGNSGNTEDGIASTKLEISVTGGSSPEPTEPDTRDEDRGCATAGGTPGLMLSLLAGVLFARRSRASGRC